MTFTQAITDLIEEDLPLDDQEAATMQEFDRGPRLVIIATLPAGPFRDAVMEISRTFYLNGYRKGRAEGREQ